MERVPDRSTEHQTLYDLLEKETTTVIPGSFFYTEDIHCIYLEYSRRSKIPEHRVISTAVVECLVINPKTELLKVHYRDPDLKEAGSYSIAQLNDFIFLRGSFFKNARPNIDSLGKKNRSVV